MVGPKVLCTRKRDASALVTGPAADGGVDRAWVTLDAVLDPPLHPTDISARHARNAEDLIFKMAPAAQWVRRNGSHPPPWLMLQLSDCTTTLSFATEGEVGSRSLSNYTSDLDAHTPAACCLAGPLGLACAQRGCTASALARRSPRVTLQRPFLAPLHPPAALNWAPLRPRLPPRGAGGQGKGHDHSGH
jgi:hypothetical protein